MRKNILGWSASILVVLALLVSGCAGTVVNMREVSAEKAAIVPEEGKAVVVFMRPSGLGFAIQSSVFEIKDNYPSLVGIVAAKTKVAYRLDPGKHLFMVIGENADFMSAEVLPNKTYYVLVTPRMGFWKARFSLDPVHKQELSTSEFKGSLDECKWVEKAPESENWAMSNMASIQSKRAEYYLDWLKTPEKERPYLLDEDGR
ncbi:MAG: hypothetical protein HYU76_00430 [Betaproteobacteria bacterium]|nr:hypothetical protein [Betaproteobacteria bacterium]